MLAWRLHMSTPEAMITVVVWRDLHDGRDDSLVGLHGARNLWPHALPSIDCAFPFNTKIVVSVTYNNHASMHERINERG